MGWAWGCISCDALLPLPLLPLTLKPRAPNFLRSCSSAWKKQMPNRSFLKGTGLGCFSKYSSEKARYPTFRFDFTPRGGSTVILIEFCKMETGNVGEGMLESHMR